MKRNQVSRENKMKSPLKTDPVEDIQEETLALQRSLT